MHRPFPVVLSLCLACALCQARPAQASNRDNEIIDSASEVLDAFTNLHLKSIPPNLLKDAQGLAIIPGVIKAGFVIGGRHGRGVLLARGADGTWGRPVFITLSGGSVGWQVGVQSTDSILVFKTKNSLDRVLNGKGKLTLGGDVAIAAGPLGRQAEAGTDGQLKAEIYSYSRSRGLFAGASLEGGVLLLDAKGTDSYYRHEPTTAVDPRTRAVVPVTPPSTLLQWKVAQLTNAPAAAPAIEVPVAPIPAPVAEPPVLAPPTPLPPGQPVPQPLPRPQ
ncbi:MAG: lipid-binding SYLF domain-containing protein [Planctomycetia bacterium]|nr:lipid-binding SYLF domain-containing protein [Planctomycetia bacterium]